MPDLDPLTCFDRAATRAAAVIAAVTPDQLAAATPCAAWNVQDLIDHMVGGTDYLRAALSGSAPAPRTATTAADYRAGLDACLVALREPGALARTCASPLGFDWTIAEATAGTTMDALIHTWDLATATGQDPDLDADVVDVCVAMFLPEMPERGRAAGLVGPAVPVPHDASPRDRLLGAMGRRR